MIKTRSIKKVYLCGGGSNGNFTDLIAIKFDDDTAEYITNDFTQSVKSQVIEYMRKDKK